MEAMLEKLFSIVWKILEAIAFVLIIIACVTQSDDDDPDDDDVFLSRAYSMFDCNVWHDTDYPEHEAEDDE
jgi:hypothetical protein